MEVLRTMALFSKVCRRYSHSRKHVTQVFGYKTSVTQDFHFFTQKLSTNLEFLSVDKVQISRDKTATPILVTGNCRPMVVMTAWMLAKRRHISKYAKVYLRRGIDVLIVRTTPWQLLRPVTGCQAVAKEVLQFLHQNQVCQPLYVHGFSVGGYTWSEVLIKINQDLQNYQPIIDRFIGQVWDSPVFLQQAPLGISLAVFPHSPILRKALQTYIIFYLKAFYNTTTCHYLAASHLFHHTILKCPALFLVSNSDQISDIQSVVNLRKKWISQNIKITWKCWEDSKHVNHFSMPDYNETLVNFLDSVSTQRNLNILPEIKTMLTRL